MHTLGSNAHRNSLNVGLQRNTRGDSDARKCSPIDAEEIARSVITVLGEHEVMEVGRRSGWVKRSRKIHPAAWIAAIVSTLAGGRVQWIADIWRTFRIRCTDPVWRALREGCMMHACRRSQHRRRAGRVVGYSFGGASGTVSVPISAASSVGSRRGRVSSQNLGASSR